MLRKYILLFCVIFGSKLLSTAQIVRINEVMSSNLSALADQSGEFPDWIELHNYGASDVDLLGYSLSDKKDDLRKWVFPEYHLKAGSYALVFASGKNLQETPLYWNTVVSASDVWRYLVPTTEPGTNWRDPKFSDGAWETGQGGIGYGDNDDATLISNSAISVFLRRDFWVDNPQAIQKIILNVDYDDGFVAYLNGVEIARSNMPTAEPFPRFDTYALANHEAVVYQGQKPEKISIPNTTGLLKAGENVLALQVHNNQANSSDLSAIAYLTLGSLDPFTNPRKIAILDYPESEFHTNFKIDAGGESVFLTGPAGEIVDSVAVVPLESDHSYGRLPDDPSNWGIYPKSTPREANSGDAVLGESAADAVFSKQGGLFLSPFALSIKSANPGDSVYYTLDGSEPDKNATLFKSEIQIKSSCVVKARVTKSGLLPGRVATNSYLFYDNKGLPIVSISMNPVDLWDYNNGIYVLGPNAETANPNFGANFWEDWERAAHIELFETSGERKVDMNAGIKIFGNWSRANAQKSLVVHARKKYGTEEIKYKLFDERPFDEFKSIVLRNSGNDWNNTMFRDGLMASLTLNLEFDQMAYRPAIIFLNGEYWGIQNIREKIDEHFLASNNEGVDPEDVNLLENNGVVLDGSANAWWEMYNFAEGNSLAIEANYTRVAGQLDISSFIDYYASQIFFDNGDWPGNNLRYWKTPDANSKWRYILFDTDFGLGIWHKPATENLLAAATATNGPGWPNPPWSTLLLRRLLENEGFRNRFVNRFADLMNSTFLPSAIGAEIDLIKNAIAREIGLHLKRWSGTSESGWTANVAEMKTFANDRPYNVFLHLRDHFGFELPKRIYVYADASQGRVQLNSLELKKFPWSGAYFGEVPVTVTARPNPGYRFVKWEGVSANENSATITVNATTKLEIRALFESDGSHYENIVINEISFNNEAQPDPGDWIELYNRGAYDMDLSGWKLTDSDSTHVFTFPPNTWLKSDDYLVVATDLSAVTTVFGGVRNLVVPLGFGLGKETDAVKLISDDQILVDEVEYSNVKPWQRFDLSQLWSFELVNPRFDNNLGSNWKMSENFGTPGAKNTPFIQSGTDIVSLGESSGLSSENYPNPFRSGTNINFSLNRPSGYRFIITDTNGRVIKQFKENDPFVLDHSIYWDGRDASGKPTAPGMYFYRIQTDDGLTVVKKMIKAQ